MSLEEIDKSGSNSETEIAHFSHPHPLVLERSEVDSSVCYGCRQRISVALCYKCNRDGCENFFLHKDCANLPLEIKHPIHDEHPLILLARPHYSNCFCSCCGKSWEGFTFNCSSCKYDLCVECAHLVLQKRTLEHNSHPHPLTLMQKPATFHCDACDQERKDLSFVCSSCPYWIHKDCAFAPSTKKDVDHDHPLSLAYHLPFELHRYHFKCDACRRPLNPSRWFYQCGRCRYFVHVNCARDIIAQATGTSVSLFISQLPNLGELLENFYSKPAPWTDVSADVIRPFIQKNCNHAIRLINETNHFSHPHQLILSSSQIDRGKNEEEMLCDACIQPITAPYYTCAACRFFLHLSCANLPTQLKHHSHTEHQLSLRKLENKCGYFYCSLCRMNCNGFFFECEPCKFRIDLLCAILPRFIIHRCHVRHLLEQNEKGKVLCDACGENIHGLSYSCLHCSYFSLHYQCAIMPPVVTHRWERHCLTLMFPPHGHHPDEFYCEICEEEIHPKRWLYHCKECDQSFHLYCIPRLGKDRFMKFGKTFEVDDHQHPLTSVRESRYGSSCNRCSTNLSGGKGFECGKCKFFLCYKCACDVPPEPFSGACVIL